MDIRCTQCGEPWDMDMLHEVVAEGRYANWDEARKGFAKTGCEALGGSHGEGTAPAGLAEIMELMGSDLDGYASLIDDFEYAGLL